MCGVDMGMPTNKQCENTVFIADQEIRRPTLLISAEFSTHHWLLKRFRKLSIFPVNQRMGLKLYFENLYTEEIPYTKDVQFFIIHLGDQQLRYWRLNLPNLKKRGDSCVAEIETFFKPEVPGTHKLIIDKVDGIQYAEKHGLTDRPYKLSSGQWPASLLCMQ
jgi:hypothetical protein